MAKKKKIGKLSKRRLVVFAPLSIFLMGVFIFNLVTYTVNILKLSHEEQQLKEKLASLELEEKNLNTEIVKLKDPDYIAKYARETYYYSANGEYVIKFEESSDEKEDVIDKKDYSNYIIYASILVLFFIFIFVLKKRKSK